MYESIPLQSKLIMLIWNASFTKLFILFTYLFLFFGKKTVSQVYTQLYTLFSKKTMFLLLLFINVQKKHMFFQVSYCNFDKRRKKRSVSRSKRKHRADYAEVQVCMIRLCSNTQKHITAAIIQARWMTSITFLFQCKIWYEFWWLKVRAISSPPPLPYDKNINISKYVCRLYCVGSTSGLHLCLTIKRTYVSCFVLCLLWKITMKALHCLALP